MLVRKIERIVQFTVVTLVATTLVACGGGRDSNPVPAGAKIELSYSEYQWDIATPADPCVVDPSYYHDHLVNLSVTNSKGLPLGDVDVNVTLDLSAATFSGTPVMALYDDKNGNGAREESELVSVNGQGAFTFKTDEYSGTKSLWVRVNLSCPYKGTLTAFSGSASAVMDLSVVESAP